MRWMHVETTGDHEVQKSVRPSPCIGRKEVERLYRKDGDRWRCRWMSMTRIEQLEFCESGGNTFPALLREASWWHNPLERPPVINLTEVSLIAWLRCNRRIRKVMRELEAETRSME